MKIIVTDGYVENPGDLSWAPLEALGEVTYYDRIGLTDEDETIRRIGDAEIAVINKAPMTRKVIDSCPNLKLITVLATGYNVVDTAAAAARGIPVCNVPDYGTEAVAQFTFALLLELCHRVGDHSRGVHGGEWCQKTDFCYWNTPQRELAGLTFGVVGYGRIGRAAARIARAFGMKVLAYGPHLAPGPLEDGAAAVTLEELFAAADVVSLHCPLTAQNAGMIDRKAIAAMKPGVLLLNTARGPLVNEADLAAALKSGRVAGAALDVVSAEPIRADNPLLGAPNCILTPHMAWGAKAARQRLMDTAVENLRSFLAGRTVNAVNL